jgi:hypothetical protein
MPAAEVRPTIVVGLLAMIVCGVVDVKLTELKREAAVAEAGGRRWSCAVAPTGEMRSEGCFGLCGLLLSWATAVKERREGEVAWVMEAGATLLLLCSGNLGT